MNDKQSNEQLYYDTLKRIARYQSPESLRRGAAKQNPEQGIPFEEALEYAYENVLDEAARVTKGRRRPKAVRLKGGGIRLGEKSP